MTDDFPANDATISKLEETVRDLQARQETFLEKLSNPTEEMMLAGALAHNAGLRPMGRPSRRGKPESIFLAMIAAMKQSE